MRMLGVFLEGKNLLPMCRQKREGGEGTGKKVGIILLRAYGEGACFFSPLFFEAVGGKQQQQQQQQLSQLHNGERGLDREGG